MHTIESRARELENEFCYGSFIMGVVVGIVISFFLIMWLLSI
jgi:hypothetical protein